MSRQKEGEPLNQDSAEFTPFQTVGELLDEFTSLVVDEVYADVRKSMRFSNQNSYIVINSAAKRAKSKWANILVEYENVKLPKLIQDAHNLPDSSEE